MSDSNMHIWKNNRLLRCGYTTGSCAAAAAKASAYMLITGIVQNKVEITTPSGDIFNTDTEDIKITESFASCSVRKYSGDDPDVTDGLLIYAMAEKVIAHKIIIDGGKGVGRVTKKGLEQPVGEAAINSVPRSMIEKEVKELIDIYNPEFGIKITISVPDGEKVAKKTFNERLGVIGGISILGTSGIVVPMSESALIDTIKLDVKLARASGRNYIIAVPGNYGQNYCMDSYSISRENIVLCSNYVGEVIDAAAEYGIKGLLLVGHIGKFVKLAANIMNTHSSMADARMEILAAHTVKAGGKLETVREILDCITTDEAVDILKRENMLSRVMDSVVCSADKYIRKRKPDTMDIGIIIYSNTEGMLGKTQNAEILLEHIMSGGK